MLFALSLMMTGDLELGYTTNPKPGEMPALFVTPTRAVDELIVVCDSAGQRYDWNHRGVAGGTGLRFEMSRAGTSADCEIFVRFQDGMVEEQIVAIAWDFGSALSVDLSNASADLKEHTLTFEVTAPIQSVEVVAYGARKAELDRQTIPVEAGPGEVTIPWVGEPDEVVLLDVKVHSEMAWAAFEFSPWFLQIPHDDVLFETNSAEIAEDQEYKLEHVLAQLNEVIELYGDVVPVKLYIGGCTDTVGSPGSNKDLSRRRAKALAMWLRTHGYDRPIYYYGFGESWLAVPTGDEADMQANRRAVYMVGANPPPPSAGVPQVGWIAL